MPPKTLCFTPFFLGRLYSFYHVEVGEALGLFHALERLSDMQFDNVDFVLDSKTTDF